jgi:CBS domain containing-hemolysin-like protein
LYLLGLELLPKSIFRRFPYRALALFVGPLRVADVVLAPMHLLGRLVQKVLFGGRPLERQRMFIGREDFRYYAEQSEKTGALTRAEREMITNVVDFRGVVAREVMQAIDPTRCLPGTMSVRDFLEKSGASAHDRWLVTDDSGAITGIVSAFEVLLERRRDVSIGVYQRRVVTVTPQEPAYSILRKLRAARSVIAIVRGPNAATPLGQISWEELIRTLVAAAGKQKAAA